MITARRLFELVKSRTFLVLTLTGNLFLVLAVLVVYFLERNQNPQMESLLNAFWWGVATITTVGYGDVVPAGIPGRIIGLILMYTGTVLFIAFTSLVAAFLVRSEMSQKLTPMERDLLKETLETEKIQHSLKEIHRRLENLEKKL